MSLQKSNRTKVQQISFIIFVPIEKYGYGLDDSTLEPAYILKIINMRYAMALNAYQQYIDTVLASDVSDETAAANYGE